MKNDRIILITGGAGGIGRAISTELATLGARVVVADLRAEDAAEVASRIGGLGIGIDVTDPESVTSSVRTVARELGPIEVLVNAVGWDELKAFVETDEAFQDRVLEINLAGPIRMTRAVLPGMIESRWGRIVQIASDAGRVGSSLEALHSAASGGLIAFSKAVARESARYRITSNTICPGPIDTPLLDSVTEGSGDAERVIDAMVGGIPMRRVGRPEDIAAAVAYLTSEKAGFVTGQTLSVSGGLTMA